MVPHVLTMTTLQIRNPVSLFILMESDDRLVHVTGSLCYTFQTIVGNMVKRKGARGTSVIRARFASLTTQGPIISAPHKPA